MVSYVESVNAPDQWFERMVVIRVLSLSNRMLQRWRRWLLAPHLAEAMRLKEQETVFRLYRKTESIMIQSLTGGLQRSVTKVVVEWLRDGIDTIKPFDSFLRSHSINCQVFYPFSLCGELRKSLQAKLFRYFHWVKAPCKVFARLSYINEVHLTLSSALSTCVLQVCISRVDNQW